MNISRIHKMKGATQGLDDGFLDGPEECGGAGRVAVCQLQCLAKFWCVENPLCRVAFRKFGAASHINADIRVVASDGGPDFIARSGEGNGRSSMFSKQEIGSAERIGTDLNWVGDAVGKMESFAKKYSLRQKIFPEDGDKPVMDFHAAGHAGGGGGAVAWCGGVENNATVRNDLHCLNDYFLAIRRDGDLHLFQEHHGETQCKRSARTCMMVRP